MKKTVFKFLFIITIAVTYAVLAAEYSALRDVVEKQRVEIKEMQKRLGQLRTRFGYENE